MFATITGRFENQIALKTDYIGAHVLDPITVDGATFDCVSGQKPRKIASSLIQCVIMEREGGTAFKKVGTSAVRLGASHRCQTSLGELGLLTLVV